MNFTSNVIARDLYKEIGKGFSIERIHSCRAAPTRVEEGRRGNKTCVIHTLDEERKHAWRVGSAFRMYPREHHVFNQADFKAID